MLDKANDQHRLQFFERKRSSSGREEWTIKQQNTTRSGGGASSSTSPNPDSLVIPSTDPIATLSEVIRTDSTRRKKYPTAETGNSPQNYQLFVDLIHQMLAYDPRLRIRPDDALNHPFITEQYSKWFSLDGKFSWTWWDTLKVLTQHWVFRLTPTGRPICDWCSQSEIVTRTVKSSCDNDKACFWVASMFSFAKLRNVLTVYTDVHSCCSIV